MNRCKKCKVGTSSNCQTYVQQLLGLPILTTPKAQLRQKINQHLFKSTRNLYSKIITHLFNHPFILRFETFA